MSENTNPLAKFFRQPAIYVKLPSQGKGWADNALDLPANGELPVLPMTAIDEITYRTPDALFNGEAVVSVIQSCCPNIKDAWAVPGSDLDVLLVAIRIASYGSEMDIETRCPSCSEEHSFGLDLRTVIDNLKASGFSEPFTKGDLTFHFRPLSYKEMNANSLLQFDQQRALQAINSNTDLPEAAKVSQLNGMMRQLITVTLKALAQSVVEIRTGDSIVTNPAHIEEFLNNCDRTIFNTVRDHVVKLREDSELRPLNIKCPSCQHDYQQMFTLDMSNFFAPAS